jgi:hypothetical protein
LFADNAGSAFAPDDACGHDGKTGENVPQSADRAIVRRLGEPMSHPGQLNLANAGEMI